MKNKNTQFIIGSLVALTLIGGGYFIYKRFFGKSRFWLVTNSAGVSVLVKKSDVELDKDNTAWFIKDGFVYSLEGKKGYQKKKGEWGGQKATQYK